MLRPSSGQEVDHRPSGSNLTFLVSCLPPRECAKIKKKIVCNDMLQFSCFVFRRRIRLLYNVEAKLPFPLCLIRNDRTNFDEFGT
jgi:hypothetical protein